MYQHSHHVGPPGQTEELSAVSSKHLQAADNAQMLIVLACIEVNPSNDPTGCTGGRNRRAPILCISLLSTCRLRVCLSSVKTERELPLLKVCLTLRKGQCLHCRDVVPVFIIANASCISRKRAILQEQADEKNQGERIRGTTIFSPNIPISFTSYAKRQCRLFLLGYSAFKHVFTSHLLGACRHTNHRSRIGMLDGTSSANCH